MRLFLLTALLAVPFFAYSQGPELDKENTWKERIFLGGGLDIGFNSNVTILGLSPSIGYRLTNTTSIGTGVTYKYVRFNNLGGSTDIYGYRFFLMQRLFRQIFAYTEYEQLSYELNPLVDGGGRFWVPSYYLGGGWYKPLSARAGFLVLALYDFNYRNSRVDPSPFIFRAGFTLSLF